MRDETQHLVRLGLFIVLASVASYIAAELLGAIRQNPRKVATVAALILLGFVIGAFFMYKHFTCKPCQERWKAWRRGVALRYVE